MNQTFKMRLPLGLKLGLYAIAGGAAEAAPCQGPDVPALMKTIRETFVLVVAMFVALACAAQSAADLDPGLRSALQRDAKCLKTGAGDAAQLSRSDVDLANFRGDRQAGVIAVPKGACPCDKENCATFVYLKSGDGYSLAFERRLASLRPMQRGFHHGLPDLAGKMQVSELKSETVVYEWDGSSYQAALCATVTARPGQKRAAIVKHQCGAGPGVEP
jgi:hypothetical protein